ncbi:MAG: zinc-binding alcohol dehydrogenase [Alphaproteobacteria bacterium]|nr:zinc-binding alcohol dehydrogenase [Alphaproteobacteria bacterium]
MRCEPLAASSSPDEVRIEALYGGISRGTERLVFTGAVPASEYERMRAPFMAGAFPFPVKYGYATVGRIVSGPDALTGRTAFALYPHQTVFSVPAGRIAVVPDGVPAVRAVLAANMETALNAMWDAAPGPADRIAVVGAGVVGCLTAWLAARLPGAEVTLIDVDGRRAAVAAALGARFAAPAEAPGDCDLVIHASASAAGLATALRLAGTEATVLELSWYGTAVADVALGGAFHSRRLRLVSSQVGQVAPSHRPRWPHGRRLAAALALLADPGLDVLLAPAVDFHDLPAELPRILTGPDGVLCQLIRYRGAP